MSDATLVLVVGVVVSAAQVVSLAAIKAWQDRNHAATQASIEVVRNDVNGKMEKMQQVIKTAALAEGNLQGHAEAKAEAEIKAQE